MPWREQTERQINQDLGKHSMPTLLGPPMVIIAFFILSDEMRSLGLWFWAAVVLASLIAGVRLLIARKLKADPPASPDAPLARLYVSMAWLMGLIWGLAISATLVVTGYNETSYVLIVTTAGFAGTAMTSLGVRRRVIIPFYALFLGPLVIATVYLYVWADGPLIVPVGIAGFTAMLLVNAAQLSSSYRQRIQQAERSKTELSGAMAHQRASGELFASLSHEVRTPMNGIVGLARLLRETKLSAEQANLLTALEGASESLVRIIDDMLDLAKLEAGQLKLSHHPFSPIMCVEELIRVVRPMAHEKALELSITYNDDVPDAVVGDVRRVRQVLLNLLSNAIKFTSEGGVHVELRSARGEGLRFGVRDTGPGLESNLDPFVAFAQCARGHDQGGSGLGLAVCHRLINLMQGTIGVDAPPDGGALFWFEVPLPTAKARRIPTHSERVAWVIDPWPTGCQATVQLLHRCGIRAEPATLDRSPPLAGGDILVAIDEIKENLKDELTVLRDAQNRIIVMTAHPHRDDLWSQLDGVVDHVVGRPLTHDTIRRVLKIPLVPELGADDPNDPFGPSHRA